MSPEEISNRARAVRLDRKALAGLSGRSEKAVGMTLGGKSSPRYDSLVAIENALTADEIRLRDYLLALHPLAKEGEAA